MDEKISKLLKIAENMLLYNAETKRDNAINLVMKIVIDFRKCRKYKAFGHFSRGFDSRYLLLFFVLVKKET